MNWGDSTLDLGWYIAALATEHYMLSNPATFPGYSTGGGGGGRLSAATSSTALSSAPPGPIAGRDCVAGCCDGATLFEAVPLAGTPPGVDCTTSCAIAGRPMASAAAAASSGLTRISA